MTQNTVEAKLVTSSGSLIDELIDTTVETTGKVLNGIGTTRVNLDPFSRGANLIRTGGEVELQVWINEALWWWGVPWQYEITPGAMTVDCEELMSYFRYRFITNTSLLYESVDQYAIAWNLLNFAQTGTNMSFNIVSGGFLNSGRLRSRPYNRSLHENILDRVQEFTTLDDGFDQELKIYGDGRREWWPLAFKGTRKGDCLFEWGSNIETFKFADDSNERANHVYATGGSENDVKFENNYQVPAPATGFFRIMQDVVSFGDEKDVAYLLELATREANIRQFSMKSLDLTVNDNSFPVLTSVEVGDIVPIRIDEGALVEAADYRIHTLTYRPDDHLVDLGVTREAA